MSSWQFLVNVVGQVSLDLDSKGGQASDCTDHSWDPVPRLWVSMATRVTVLVEEAGKQVVEKAA